MRRSTMLGAQAMMVAMTVVLAACTGTEVPDAASSSGSEAPAPTVAPNPSPVPAPAPAPEPREGEPFPLVVESLAVLEWSTDCYGERRMLALSPTEEPGPMAMRPGGPLLEHVDDPTSVSSMRFTVDLSVVAEMTIGGTPALAVDTFCFLGNGFLNAVEVWGVDGEGWPVQLPSPLGYSKTDGYVIDLAGEDDVLVLTMRVGAPGDDWPHLNGYPYIRVSEHRFDGTRWTMTVRSLVEQHGT
jgi:hypothetical protein